LDAVPQLCLSHQNECLSEWFTSNGEEAIDLDMLKTTKYYFEQFNKFKRILHIGLTGREHVPSNSDVESWYNKAFLNDVLLICRQVKH